MFPAKSFKLLLLNLLAILSLWPCQDECLIITSVIAGDKKFRTISFNHKFLKPLTFESDLPNTSFRRHRTLRPPKFDIDVNIPIKLPLEEEYQPEEHVKPVENNLFFQSGEIDEPARNKPKTYLQGSNYQKENRKEYKEKKLTYKDEMSAASSSNQFKKQQPIKENPEEPLRQQPQFDDAKVRRQDSLQQYFVNNQNFRLKRRNGLPNMMPRIDNLPMGHQMQSQEILEAASSGYYRSNKQGDYGKESDFIPGGFVNLQLSGPTGGPHMTYQDYDREKWAQQLSQTPNAMPFPILNYHQLQNFYGGLGTFTNGLADNRYSPESSLDKFTSGFHRFKSTIQNHMG